jgi:hypothetical protein
VVVSYAPKIAGDFWWPVRTTEKSRYFWRPVRTAKNYEFFPNPTRCRPCLPLSLSLTHTQGRMPHMDAAAATATLSLELPPNADVRHRLAPLPAVPGWPPQLTPPAGTQMVPGPAPPPRPTLPASPCPAGPRHHRPLTGLTQPPSNTAARRPWSLLRPAPNAVQLSPPTIRPCPAPLCQDSVDTGWPSAPPLGCSSLSSTIFG